METNTQGQTAQVTAKTAAKPSKAAAKVLPVTGAAFTLANLGEMHKEAGKLQGEPLRLACVAIAAKLEEVAPIKVVFSSDKDKRKAQMEAFAKAKGEHQKLSRANHQWLSEHGLAETSIRYSGSVSATGIVTSREVNTAKVRPPKGATIRY